MLYALCAATYSSTHKIGGGDSIFLLSHLSFALNALRYTLSAPPPQVPQIHCCLDKSIDISLSMHSPYWPFNQNNVWCPEVALGQGVLLGFYAPGCRAQTRYALST